MVLVLNFFSGLESILTICLDLSVHSTGMFENIRNDPFLVSGPEVRPHVVTVIMEQSNWAVNDFHESREVAMMFADILRLPEGQS